MRKIILLSALICLSILGGSNLYSQDDCPAGSMTGGSGPEMVRLAAGFCMDQTEVSRGQYETWIDTEPATDQTGACAMNDDFVPTCRWEAGKNKEDQPVVCVDWCDAKAFCEAAGKRLCGKVGTGESYDFENYDNPLESEWQNACSSAGKYEYSYGNESNTDSCRDADAEDYKTWGLGDVGSFEGCHSPDAKFGDIRDLSGHAAEWDNSCMGEGADDACRIRGGSFQHHGAGLRCAMGKGLEWPRMRKVESVGFRCCK